MIIIHCINFGRSENQFLVLVFTRTADFLRKSEKSQIINHLFGSKFLKRGRKNILESKMPKIVENHEKIDLNFIGTLEQMFILSLNLIVFTFLTKKCQKLGFFCDNIFVISTITQFHDFCTRVNVVYDN